MSRFPARTRRGFTILEMAIVLLIIGLIGSLLVGASSAYLEAQRRKAVRVQLDAIDVALVNFVALNKRLPCPANGTIAYGLANAGVETINLATGACNPVNQQNGVVPWVTLGLPEGEGSDPWHSRFSYRVDPALASNLTTLMNMSNCDPSSTGPTGVNASCQAPAGACTGNANCTSPANYLANKGLDVWDGLNAAAGFAARSNNRANGSGAAYVLISHGPNGHSTTTAGGLGVYLGTGIFRFDGIQAGMHELPNLNGQAIALPGTVTNAYRDAPVNDVNDTALPPLPAPQVPGPGNHFDDYLSHPTIMTVLGKANLGARAH